MLERISSLTNGALSSSRREFLRRLSSAAALSVVVPALDHAFAADAGSAATQKTLVGSQAYGWGQYAQREKKKLDVAEVISSLRDAGYDYLENSLDLANPEQNAVFAEQLKAKGLQPVSLYTTSRLHEAAQTGAVVAKTLAAAKLARQAGFQIICCNPAPIGREKTDEELKTQVAGLTELGQGLNALGLKLAIHNHTPEMANHAREFHFNFDHTKPAEVGFCYDVHWVYRGGIMPLDALGQYGNRLLTWHLRQSRNGLWWEDLDTGDVDYAAIAKYARAHNLPRLFTVELALEGGTTVTRSAVENHRLSREYVRRVFQSQS
jgi:inosose dehydratase